MGSFVDEALACVRVETSARHGRRLPASSGVRADHRLRPLSATVSDRRRARPRTIAETRAKNRRNAGTLRARPLSRLRRVHVDAVRARAGVRGSRVQLKGCSATRYQQGSGLVAAYGLVLLAAVESPGAFNAPAAGDDGSQSTELARPSSATAAGVAARLQCRRRTAKSSMPGVTGGRALSSVTGCGRERRAASHGASSTSRTSMAARGRSGASLADYVNYVVDKLFDGQPKRMQALLLRVRMCIITARSAVTEREERGADQMIGRGVLRCRSRRNSLIMASTDPGCAPAKFASMWALTTVQLGERRLRIMMRCIAAGRARESAHRCSSSR